MRADVSDVGDTVRVRGPDLELPILGIRRHRRRQAAARPRLAPLAHLGLEPFRLHQAIDPVLAARLTEIAKVTVHFR